MIKNKILHKGELSTGLAMLALTISVVGLIVGFNLALTQPQTSKSEAQSLSMPTFSKNTSNSAVTVLTSSVENRSGFSNQYVLNGTLCFNSPPPSASSYRVRVGNINNQADLGASVIRNVTNGNSVKCGSGSMTIGAVFNKPTTGLSTFAQATYTVWVDADFSLSDDEIGTVIFEIPNSPTPAQTATPMPTRDPNATSTPIPFPSPIKFTPTSTPTQPPTPTPTTGPGPISGTVTVTGADATYDFVTVVKCAIVNINAAQIVPDLSNCNDDIGNLKTSFRSSYDYQFSDNDDPTTPFIVYAYVTKDGNSIKESNRAIDCPSSLQNVQHPYMCIVRGNSRQNFNINLNGSVTPPPGSDNVIPLYVAVYNAGSTKITAINARTCLATSTSTCGVTTTEATPADKLAPQTSAFWTNEIEKVAGGSFQLELWGTFETSGEGPKRIFNDPPFPADTSSLYGSTTKRLYDSGQNSSESTQDMLSEVQATDVDLNGCINSRDFSQIVARYYEEVTPDKPIAHDINKDGIVNGVDLSYLYPNWLAGNCRLETPTP